MVSVASALLLATFANMPAIVLTELPMLTLVRGAKPEVALPTSRRLDIVFTSELCVLLVDCIAGVEDDILVSTECHFLYTRLTKRRKMDYPPQELI